MYRGAVELKSGEYEIITCDNDLVDIVREKIGDGMAECVLNLISDADYTKARVDTDLESYESSLDSCYSALSDISDITDELGKHLQGSRINRDNIGKMIKDVNKIINNQI